jgi:hypothetical protein
MTGKLVVVNRSILSQNHSGVVVNCMHPNPLHNPFYRHDVHRDEKVSLFRTWLWKKIQSKDKRVLNALSDIKTHVLRGSTVYLMCCCKPASCHCDVIKNCVNWVLNK